MKKDYLVKSTFDNGKTVEWNLYDWQIIDHAFYSKGLITKEQVWEDNGLGKMIELTVKQGKQNPRFVVATRPDGTVAFSGYAGNR